MSLHALRAEFVLDEGDFKAVDTMAVELEVAELLYALVRQIKPAIVVEAGAGKGYASRFIAEAIRENEAGWLLTFEQDPEYAGQAAAMLAGLPATVVGGYSTGYVGLPPDLVFIDSLGGLPRERDMERWFAHPARPLIVVHDANGYPAETFTGRGTGVFLTAGRGLWIGRAS